MDPQRGEGDRPPSASMLMCDPAARDFLFRPPFSGRLSGEDGGGAITIPPRPSVITPPGRVTPPGDGE